MAEPVYEMLWDCRYCGGRKLLGLTHRHCPNCGAPQDPSSRYFPPDHEKVAVQNHEYVGSDLQCRYCGAASSRKAHNCGRCGAALAEGAPVQAQPDAGVHVQQFAPPPPSTPPPRALWKLLLPVGLLVVVGAVVLLLVWKKEQKFVAVSHDWRRTITVERLAPQRGSAWCDQLPSGARDVSRHREKRSTKQVPDGEDCKSRKTDRGDGTFVEVQDCSPQFRSEPIYDDKCDYSIVEWGKLRVEQAEGTLAAEPPSWPAAALARPGCSSIGCEREGERDETYTVVFRDSKGKTYRCDLDQKAWKGFAEGKSYSGKLRALVGTLDCSSLSAAR